MAKIKKYKLKKKFSILTKVVILIGFFIVLKKVFITSKYINYIEYKDNNYIVHLNKNNISCYLSDEIPNNNANWVKSKDKKCIIDYKAGINDIYINDKGKIYNATSDRVYYLNTIDTNKYFFALNDSQVYIKDLIGNLKYLNIKSNDSNIAYIDDSGYLISKNKGQTYIEYEYNKINTKLDIIVTDLITKRPTQFDFDKSFLKCNQYSKEENDLLDEILKAKIDSVGYKTRAAAVEAARFLTLDFPYKISYFHENGRQTTNKVDGEGRYYHEGLFLNNTRYDKIISSSTGPKIWGCSLYSNPIKEYMSNGLDCSGFVSWVLLNAGFDVKDVGAGFKDGKLNDLTDFGDLEKLNKNTLKMAKVGDLLHSNHTGGHIAIIVGIDDSYYYVAQALWENAPTSLTKKSKNDISVQITKYSSAELINVFPHVVLMDKYYINEGYLTSMW